MTSPYLLRPLRTFEQALRDRQRLNKQLRERGSPKSSESTQSESVTLDDGHDSGGAKRE
jgi:hypothetical protein